MRDIKRIPIILEKVEKIWEKNPDLRLGQLLLNVCREPTLYYIEDEDLVEMMALIYERGD